MVGVIACSAVHVVGVMACCPAVRVVGMMLCVLLYTCAIVVGVMACCPASCTCDWDDGLCSCMCTCDWGDDLFCCTCDWGDGLCPAVRVVGVRVCCSLGQWVQKGHIFFVLEEWI